MAVYRFQMPDGSVARIQANTPEEGMTYATSLSQKPGASQDKGNRSAADQQTYLSELQKRRAATAAGDARVKAASKLPVIGGAIDKLESMGAGEAAPVAGEIIGGLRAGGNAAANLFRAPQDKVSSRAIFDANRDATDETSGAEIARNPVSAGAGSVGSLLYGGGELVKGAGLLKDLPAVVKAGGALKALPGATRTAGAVNAVKAAAASRIAPKVLDYGGRVGGAAATGGAVGGALGFADGSDLDERIQNATHGAAAGAAGGALLEGVAAPVLKPLIGVGVDAVRGAGRLLAPKADEAITSAADRVAAQQAVGRIAKSAGVNSGNLGARTAGYADLDQTAAEALGSTGQNILGATARRAGTTGDNLRAQMRLRAAGQPSAIVADFKEMMGVDPEAAAGNIDHMVEAGRAKAGPEFQDYFDSTQGGITSPEIERLLATPEGAKQARGVEKFAKNTGRPQSGLTYGRVETPEPVQGVRPVDAPVEGRTLTDPNAAPPDLGAAAQVRVPRGPAQPPSRGPSALSYLRQTGHGVGDNLDLPEDGFRLGVRKGGNELHDMAIALQQGGYTGKLLNEDEVYKLFDTGKIKSLYAREADPRAQAAFDARAGAEDQNRVAASEHYGKQQDSDAAFRQQQASDAEELAAWRKHVDESGNADEYRSLATGHEPPPAGYGGTGVHAPHYEPALQESLTGEGLDLIRRRANDSVTWENGRPVRTGKVGLKNKEPSAFSEDFTTALKTGPYGDKLAKALETSGDYLGIQRAFNDTKGQLTSGTARAFGKTWAKLAKGAQRDAARSALASDVIDLWGKGQLRGGKFASPDVRAKLELAFGKEGAREFVADVTGFAARMDRRAELAGSGNRMAPFSGSPTMTLQEAAGATDEMAPLVPPAARIAGKVLTGHPLQAAGDALKTLVGAYRKTSGTTTGFRNELGRILSLPSDDPEFVSLLRDFEKATPEQKADFLGRMGVPGDRATRAGVTAGVVQHGASGDPERR